MIHIYYLGDMLATLFLFTIAFVSLAAVALVLFLLDRASQHTLDWVEPQAKEAGKLARRAWTSGRFRLAAEQSTAQAVARQQQAQEAAATLRVLRIRPSRKNKRFGPAIQP